MERTFVNTKALLGNVISTSHLMSYSRSCENDVKAYMIYELKYVIFDALHIYIYILYIYGVVRMITDKHFNQNKAVFACFKKLFF